MTIPAIDQSLLPADIRKAGAATQKAYSAGVSFERQLVGELTKQLVASTKVATDDGGDDSGSGDGTDSNPYASMMPDALADSITANGGLGLARQLAGLPSTITPTTTTEAASS